MEESCEKSFLDMTSDQLNQAREKYRSTFNDMKATTEESTVIFKFLINLQDLREGYEDGIRLLYFSLKQNDNWKKSDFNVLCSTVKQHQSLQNELWHLIQKMKPSQSHDGSLFDNKTSPKSEEGNIKDILVDKEVIKKHVEDNEDISDNNFSFPTVKVETSDVKDDEILHKENLLNYDDETFDNIEEWCQIENKKDEQEIEKENKREALNVQKKGRYPCSYCPKVFCYPQKHKVHEASHTIQDDNKHFTCEVCHKQLADKQTLKVHMRIHTGEKPFKCDQCPKACSQLATLIRHKRTHTGEKPFTCDQCGREFRENSALKTHMRIHSGEKPFACDLCDLKFAQHAGLRSHKLIHHSTGTEAEKKPFKCDQCFKDFAFKTQLKTHMRTHTGERPYECELCLKTFTDYSTLKYHVKVHKGEKNFRCEICGKSWIRQSNLRTHMRTHTGERPFKCTVCDKDFARKDRLKSHEKRHCKTSDGVPAS